MPGPNGRARRHVLGRCGGNARATARAFAAVHVDARGLRLQRRQIDVIVAMHVRLILGLGNTAAAVAALGEHVAHVIGVRAKPAGDARPAFVRFLCSRRTVGLLAFRRRQRGVVGSLRRNVQTRLELGDASLQRRDLRSEQADLLGLRQDQRDQLFSAQRIDCVGSHPELESAPHSLVNRRAPSPIAACQSGGATRG